MAENEAKARKKLEEAEKKAKGGGGFLGSLFGGSKTDEAAELFVQEQPQPSWQAICRNESCQSAWQRWRQRSQDRQSPTSTDNESDSDSEEDDNGLNEISCIEKGCGEIFTDICSYEEHYERDHRHQCGLCGRKFVSEHCLEIHADETHSWLFQAQLNANFKRHEEKALFRCFDSSCSKVFLNYDDRSFHSLKEHFIEDDGAIISQKRKTPKKSPSEQNASEGSETCGEIGEAFGEMKMPSSSPLPSSKDQVKRVGQSGLTVKPRVIAVPRAIVFGATDLDAPQPMFESGSVRRPMLKTRKAHQKSKNPQ